MAESSLNWDDLSDTPPALPPVAPGSDDPDADSIVAKMNAGVAAGKSEDEILSTEVADFGRKGRRASAETDSPPKSVSWDDLSFTKPHPEDSDIAAQQNVYNAPNYQPVYNSPNAALAQPDAFKAPPETWGEYLSGLGSAAKARIGETIGGGVRAAGEVGGEAIDTAINAPINAVAQPLGLPQSDVGDEAAQATADVGAQQYQKYASEEARARGHLLTGEDNKLGYIAQEAAIGAPTMAAAIASGPVGGAALFGGSAAAEKYGQARAEGEPVNTATASAAIEGGVSALTADLTFGRALNPEAIGALKRIGETTGTNVAGSVINEATNIATEMHVEGKDVSADEIKQRLAAAAESATVVGAGLGAYGAAAEHAATPPAERAAARARALTEQTAINEGVQIAKNAGESSGMSDAIAEAKTAAEAPPVQPEETTNATETGKIPENNQPEHPRDAQSGLPAEASGGGSDANGAAQGSQAVDEDAAHAHAAARAEALSNLPARALTDSERAEWQFLESRPDAATIAAAYRLKPKEKPNVDTNTQQSAGGGAETAQTPARRPSEVRATRLQELRETGEAQGLTPDQVREYGALVNADRTQGRIAHTGEPIEGLLNEAGRQEKIASGEIPGTRAFIDLVGFHDFNEKHGYANGNAVLRMFGRELANQLPKEHGSVVGGDEFYAHGTPEQLAAAEQGLREKLSGAKIAVLDKDGNVIDRVPAPDFRMGQGENDASAQAAAKQNKPSGRPQAEGNAQPDVGAARARGEETALDPTGTGYSRGEEQSPGVNAFVARKALEKAFGARAVAKMEAAGLKLAASDQLPKLAPKLPEHQRGGVKGVTTGAGQPHLIHDQTPSNELAGVAVHEIWHANRDRVLSPGQEAGLARRVDELAKHSPKVRAAVEAIPVGERTAGEKVAYTLEHLQDQSLGRRALDSIKLGLNRLGVPLDWMNAHEAALREIGALNLRHFQEAEPRSVQVGANKPRFTGAQVARGEHLQSQGTDQSQLSREPTAEHVPGTFNPEAVRDYMARIGKPVATAAPQPGERTQGVKNAYKAQERTERGLEPLDAEGKRDFGAVWEAATAKRQDDPGAGARLAADVANDPRPLRPEETALLIQHGAELNNRYDKVLSDIDAARKSGDRALETDAQLRRREIEDLLSIHDIAARQSGYEQGLGLAMRKAMAKQDYSLARQMARFKAIETDGKIPEMVRKRVEGYVKEIAELTRQRDEALAAREPARRGASKPRKALDDDFTEMAARLKAIAGGRSAEQFARVADPEMAALIRKMARNRSDAGETDPARVLDAIHEAIGRSVPKQDIADTITTNAPARQHTKGELQARYDALRKSLRDPDVQRNAVRQKAIAKELAEIKSRIQRGDFEKAKRVPPVYNEATTELQAKLAAARRKLDLLAKQRERLQSGPVARTADLIHNIHMGAILSSLHVYPKLAAAVAARWVGTPLEEAIGAVVRHVPGISRVAALAPRHGAGFTLGAEAEALRGIGRGVRGAGEQLRYGESKLDQLYGDKAHMSGEFTDFMGQLADALGPMEKARVFAGIPGRTHAAVKELASQPEFYRSYRLRENHLRDQLAGSKKSAAEIDEFLGRESTKAALGAKAYEGALEAKMQGKNWVADGVNTIINHFERNGGVGGKALAFLFKTIFPIRKVPINIAKEITSYSIGGIKAAVASLHGELTPERADYIMKNIKKQGAGAVLFALGYLGSSMFGGIPGTEKKKAQTGIKPDEANIGGMELGTLIFHSPAAQMLQLGAGFRKVFERDYGKSHDTITAGLESIGSNYGNLMVRSIPYLDQPRRMYNTYEWGRNSTFADRGHGAGEVVGGQLRSMLIPQMVQQVAAGNVGIDAVDNYLREKGIADPNTKPFARHPKNMLEDVELGIPGLRENVSTRRPH